MFGWIPPFLWLEWTHTWSTPWTFLCTLCQEHALDCIWFSLADILGTHHQAPTYEHASWWHHLIEPSLGFDSLHVKVGLSPPNYSHYMGLFHEWAHWSYVYPKIPPNKFVLSHYSWVYAMHNIEGITSFPTQLICCPQQPVTHHIKGPSPSHQKLKDCFIFHLCICIWTSFCASTSWITLHLKLTR